MVIHKMPSVILRPPSVGYQLVQKDRIWAFCYDLANEWLRLPFAFSETRTQTNGDLVSPIRWCTCMCALPIWLFAFHTVHWRPKANGIVRWTMICKVLFALIYLKHDKFGSYSEWISFIISWPFQVGPNLIRVRTIYRLPVCQSKFSQTTPDCIFSNRAFWQYTVLGKRWFVCRQIHTTTFQCYYWVCSFRQLGFCTHFYIDQKNNNKRAWWERILIWWNGQDSGRQIGKFRHTLIICNVDACSAREMKCFQSEMCAQYQRVIFKVAEVCYGSN